MADAAVFEQVLADARLAAANRGSADGPRLTGTGLPRLRGKQAPRGGWEQMPFLPWVLMCMAEERIFARADAEAERAEGDQTGAPNAGARWRTPPSPVAPTKKPAGHPRMKPAGNRGTTNFCPGCEGKHCVFSTKTPGSASQGKPGAVCSFCSAASLRAALETPRGRGNVTRSLKVFYSRKDEHGHVWTAVKERLEEWVPEEAEALTKKASQAKREKPRASRADLRERRAAATNDAWDACKKRRRAVTEEAAAPARKKYRAEVHAEQRRADITKAAQPEIMASACRRCKAKRPHIVPQPADVPEPLQGLSPEIVEALRPLDIDVGEEVRAGNGCYRKKVRMITFSWALQSVDSKIAALGARDVRRKARAARRYLLENPVDNEYHDYYERHNSFIVRHRDEPTAAEAKRPLHFIEEPGLETALWPHLYWKTSMCESFERLNRRRLQQLEAKKQWRGQQEDEEDAAATEAAEPEDNSSSEEGEDSAASSAEEEVAKEPRRSIKRSFQAKLLSPLLGYGSDFTLLQYVYDLHLWTDLGSKRNQADGMAMRLMMQGHPMSPYYWHDIKLGLFDLVKQLGYPQLYWTLAPWEPSFPYHQFLLDEMQKLLVTRTHLPAFEAMSIAHVMLQTCRNLLAGGGTQQGAKGWKRHLLSNHDPAIQEQVNNCVGFFTRVEYQDGSKKEGTQRYHGSGRPHVHALFWLRDMASTKLEASAAASLQLGPGMDVVAAFARGSQLDRSGESKWPVHPGASEYVADEGRLQLHHTEEDAEGGVRGCFIPVMDALRCHQDLQIAHGRYLLLKYVTKYVAKWSDSSYSEWMSDSASVTSLCRKVLVEYHPMEPEMTLQLTGATFRQWDFGTVMGGRRSVRVPRPSNQEQPGFVHQYMRSEWQREEMALLEYLRKSDAATGGIARWLRQRWEKDAAGQAAGVPLETFANAYTMQEEQIVAADYLWRLNDGYYGQWCLMHLPFRSLDGCQVAAVQDKVPFRYRWLATDARLPPPVRGYWRDPARIRADMEQEADTAAFIEDVVGFVGTQIAAIDRYLSGQLDRREEPAPAPKNRHQAGNQQEDFELEGKQAVLFRQVAQRVQRGMELQAAASDEEWDTRRAKVAEAAHRPIVCSGRPGTGKSTVLHRNVRATLEAGGSVLLALPTARLSNRTAEKFESQAQLVVDTAAAAFQFHKPEQETLYAINAWVLFGGRR